MYGAEYGAILPNKQQSPMDTFQQQRNFNVQQARYQEQVQRQQQDRQDQMLYHVMNNLDFKNFATGTPLDHTVVTTLNDGIKGLSKQIQDNPNMRASELMYQAQNIANNVNQYSQKAKLIRAGIEQGLKEYASNPSVDQNALYKGAMSTAFMKYDPKTHQMTMKDPSEIDEGQDYLTGYLNSYPETVINNDKTFLTQLKGAEKKNYEKEFTTDNKGVKRTVAYKGEYYPAFNQLQDDKGNPVADGGAATRVGIRSQSVQLPNGQKVNVADDNTYNYFTSDKVTNAWLNAQVKRAGIDPNSDMGEVARRKILFDHLQNNNPGYINNTKNDVNVDSLREKYDMGLLGVLKSFGADKEQKKIAQSPIFGVVNALAGNKSFMGDNNETEKDWTTGKDLVNITPYIPGAALYSGKIKKGPDGSASKEAFAGVYIDPQTKQLVLKDVSGKIKDGDNKPQKDENGNDIQYYNFKYIPIKEEKQVLEQIGQANGMSKDEVTKLYNQILANDPDRQAASELQGIKKKNVIQRILSGKF
jgi:hypothetical protein